MNNKLFTIETVLVAPAKRIDGNNVFVEFSANIITYLEKKKIDASDDTKSTGLVKNFVRSHTYSMRFKILLAVTYT